MQKMKFSYTDVEDIISALDFTIAEAFAWEKGEEEPPERKRLKELRKRFRQSLTARKKNSGNPFLYRKLRRKVISEVLEDRVGNEKGKNCGAD